MKELMMNLNLNSPIVIDGLFSEEEQNSFLQEFRHLEFPWYLSQGTVRDYDVGCYTNDKTFEYLQFVHAFLMDSKIIQSSWMNMIRYMIDKIQNSLSKEFKFIRIKANLLPRFERTNSLQLHNTPHTDTATDHIVLIYYVNDSDGNTYLYENQDRPENITRVIEPKKGRLLIFDGKHLHCGAHPIKEDYRIALNFVALKE